MLETFYINLLTKRTINAPAIDIAKDVKLKPVIPTPKNISPK